MLPIRPKSTVTNQLVYRGAMYESSPSTKMVVAKEFTPEEQLNMLLSQLLTKKELLQSGSFADKLTYLSQQDQLQNVVRTFLKQKLGDEYQNYADVPEEPEDSDEGGVESTDTEDNVVQQADLYLEAVKEKFRPFIDSLYAEAGKVLTDAGVDYKQNGIQLSAVEEDGLDVLADVAVGNKITAFGGAATITMDYALKFKFFTNKEDYYVSLDQLKVPPLVKDIVKSAPNLDETTVKLQEIIVHLCEHNFAAQGDKQIYDLLSNVISFLQKGSTLRMERGALGAMPGGADDTAQAENFEQMSQAQKEDWLKEKLTAFVDFKLNEYVGVQIDPAHRAKQWSDKAKFEQIIKAFTESPATIPAGVSQSDWNKIVKYIKSMLPGMTPSRFATLMKDAMESKMQPGKGESTAVSVVENAVRELSAHEKYTGKINVGFSQEGFIVASIDAPYKFRYHFKKAGVGVQLLNAMMEFCGHKMVVTSLDDAKKLLTTDLDLATAYKRAVNPSLSQNSESTDYEKFVRKIYDTTLRLKEEQQGMDAAPQVQQEKAVPPTAEKPQRTEEELAARIDELERMSGK